MANLAIVAVIALAVGAAITYIVKEKKKGTVCIGCPSAGTCSRAKGGASGCSCHTENK